MDENTLKPTNVERLKDVLMLVLMKQTMNFFGDTDHLIPKPTVELLADILTIEKVPKKRWRSYILTTDWENRDWTPGFKKHPDKLEAKKEYHARMVYETSCYLSITTPEWISVRTIKLIQVTAHFEMRKCEIMLISYKLAAQLVGLKKDLREMYQAASTLFQCNNWVAEKIFSAGEKTKERRALLFGCKQLRPCSADTAKTLGENIDKLLYSLMCFIKDENFKAMISTMPDSDFVEELGNYLKKCILLLDVLLLKVE
jgi:hypothetical protein